MSRYSPEGLSLDEIATIRDDDIDFSDIPELTDDFFVRARVATPDDRMERVTLSVRRSVLEAFKARGNGYEALMSAALERYVRSRSSKG